MSIPTAKDLLAQADRLMRQRVPEELPVLTDLVIEEIEITSLPDRMDDVIPTHSRPAWASVSAQPMSASPAPNPHLAAPNARVRASASPPAQILAAPAATPVAVASRTVDAADVLGVLPRMAHDAPPVASRAAGPNTVTAMANVREQFNAQLLTKLEELQHSVYSQVMQQLEIYAAGSLKTHLRETLLPALTDIARDIAEQVAEDTSNQLREVVSKAVDSEIARLREQLAKRRT
jgi:hypothetical protein